MSFKMPTFKIILFGDELSEKQSLTRKYCDNIFNFNPAERLTISVDFFVKTLNLHGRTIKLKLWDVGGEPRFKFLLHQYCKGANVALLLYDIVNGRSLDHLADLLWRIRRRQILREHSEDIPIILVGTNFHLHANRVVTREVGMLIAKKFNLSAFAEISARTGQNVDLLFETVAELLLSPESRPRHVIEIPEPEIVEEVPEDQ